MNSRNVIAQNEPRAVQYTQAVSASQQPGEQLFLLMSKNF